MKVFTIFGSRLEAIKQVRADWRKSVTEADRLPGVPADQLHHG